MAFIQQGPRLAHPLHHDRVLRAWLHATFDASERAVLEADLTALGDYALLAHARALETPREEPVLTTWDAWGQRVDRIALSTTWREGAALTTRHGLLWSGQEAHARGLQRAAQFARVYLYHAASAFYTCPLAMTDGAIAALKAAGLDTDGLHPKDIDAVMNEDIDLVVTVCDNAREACPIFPKPIPAIHLPFHDPHGEPLESFLAVRDDIRARLVAAVREKLGLQAAAA